MHEADTLVICVSFSTALGVIIDLVAVRADDSMAGLERNQASVVGVISQASPLRVRVLEACDVAHIRWGSGIHTTHSRST